MKLMPDWDVTRRAFLAAAVGTLLPKVSWNQGTRGSALCWKLDGQGDNAHEENGGTDDPIVSRTGHALWVGSGRNRALRLDGYSVWINHAVARLPLHSEALTVSAWLALESYPVDEAAIVEQAKTSDGGFRFGVDKLGFLVMNAQTGTAWTVCTSESRMPRGQWMHLAASISATGEITLYRDGVFCGQLPGRGRLSLARDRGLTLARSNTAANAKQMIATGVLNGLIRDVRIFDQALSRQSLEETALESKPDSAPDLQLNGDWCGDDPQRPIFHAMPPRAWTNEPHGLIHWGGQYHLFYQKNANGPYWGQINWGHMTSPDLYRWTEIPVALTPEPGVDSAGCWSGSVIEHDGKLAIIYTAGDGAKASICLAQSEDGIHFAKHPGNPVIAAPPYGFGFPEFRDPHVWREGDTYYLLVGSAIKDVGGTALLYRSKDLITWEYRKPLLVGDRETSGVFWEMPIFIHVGGDRRALIVCEVPGRASYWVGTWKDETFTPLAREPQRMELFNHLLSPTPLNYKDGRTIAIGIIPDERGPLECWRAGWAHLYSLPRVLSADEHGRMHQTPLEDIEQWSEPQLALGETALASGVMKTIDGAAGKFLSIRAAFRRDKSRSISLKVRSSADGQEYTEIKYDWEFGSLTLDRSHSSLNEHVRKDVRDATYFPDAKDNCELHVLLDNSVLEVFVDRRASFAARIYPTLEASNGCEVGCDGGDGVLVSLTIARVNKTAVTTPRLP